MVQIMRVTTRWSGFTGSPGFTVFHLRDFSTEGDVTQAQADAAVTRVRSFWTTANSVLPSLIQLQVSSDVEIIEDTTGTLVDSISAGVPNASIAGTLTGSVAGPAGAVINWRTSAIKNGRRIRGRTFIVPMATSAYEANGSLTATAQQNLQIAADNLADSTGTPDLGVYSRPTLPEAGDGQWAVATSGSVPDLVAVLRSRRD